jgi:hypothetical protein
VQLRVLTKTRSECLQHAVEKGAVRHAS